MQLLKFLFTLFLFTFNLIASNNISIGTVDIEQKKRVNEFQALASYLEEELKKDGISFSVEIPKNLNRAVELINDKKLDIYIDSVYPTLLMQKNCDISIFLKRWKKGVESYNSIIYTKKDSPINSINDLKGKSIAFEDNYSTSGYYIPKKTIEKAGLTLSKTSSNNSVKYMFAKSEENTIVWLMFGKVDASVTDNITLFNNHQNKFKKIYTSKPIPRHLVSISNRINKKLRKKILDILLNMHKSKKGQEALRKFSKTKKFSKLTDNDLSIIRDFN